MKHRCYVLFNPDRPDGLPRCHRCEIKKKGCSLSAYEPRASTNSEKRTIPGKEGYQLSLLQQVVAKRRKAKGLTLPDTPEDAVKMLRTCHPKQTSFVEEFAFPNTDIEDYRGLNVYSGDEWSMDEAFGSYELEQEGEDVGIEGGRCQSPSHPCGKLSPIPRRHVSP